MPQSDFGSVYQVGDLLRLQVSFTDSVGTAVDPTTVALSVINPAGTETEYTYAGGSVTKSATGTYYYDLTVSSSGRHLYRWLAGGAYVAADEGSFTVAKSAFA